MDFAAFRPTDDERMQLLAAQNECTVSWLNSDGWPVSAFLTYVFERDAFWVTSFRDRPGIDCLIGDPRSTVAVSSAVNRLAMAGWSVPGRWKSCAMTCPQPNGSTRSSAKWPA
ncbi:hypothetical protein MOKP101_49440 [Mycobacterium avium subsp. hominissuis]